MQQCLMIYCPWWISWLSTAATYPLSYLSFDRLQEIDIPFSMWRPNNSSIFQNRVYNFLICHILGLTTVTKHWGPWAIQGPGSVRSNKYTMVMLTQLRVHIQAKIFHRIVPGNRLLINGVSEFAWITFVSDSQ